MRKVVFLFAAALTVCAFCACSAARADSFSFTFAGSGLTGSASLSGTADSSLPDAFDITSGTLMMNGMSFVLTPDASAPGAIYSVDGEYIYNNVFYTSGGSIVDLNGLLFNNGAGGEVNLFQDGGYVVSSYGYAGSDYNTQPVAVTVTPEPSSLALLGTCVVGAAILLRRKIFSV